MVDVLGSMIEGVADALRLGDREAAARARRQDDLLDALNSEIKQYLTRLDPDTLTDDEHRRAEAVVTFSLNLEGAGDVVERSLASFVAKRLKRGVESSPEDDGRSGRLSRLSAQTCAPRRRCSRPATGAPRGSFRSRRPSSARARVKPSRLISPGFASSARATAPALDLLRDIKRLNDHLVAGAAYPVLEAGGN
jgi:phosphate:Na+ symporter